MYTDKTMLESIKKVEAARAQNTVFEPRRMTADEKEKLLATYHPDYKQDQFAVLSVGFGFAGMTTSSVKARTAAASSSPAAIHLERNSITRLLPRRLEEGT